MPIFTQPIHEHGDPERPGPYPHRTKTRRHGPKRSAVLQGLRDKGVTTNPFETGFLLPDGTRIKKRPEVIHADMVVNPGAFTGADKIRALYHALDLGVIRYVPEQGIYLSQPPSEKQAAVIADDWNTYFEGQPLRLDWAPPERRAGPNNVGPVLYHVFQPPIHASAIRNWTRRQQNA